MENSKTLNDYMTEEQKADTPAPTQAEKLLISQIESLNQATDHLVTRIHTSRKKIKLNIYSAFGILAAAAITGLALYTIRQKSGQKH